MAVQSTPYVETALQHSSELFRRALQSTLPLGSAGGVVPATPAVSANLSAGVAGCSDLAVTAPVSGMSVNVNPGQIIIPGSLGSGSGYGMGIGYGYPVITTNGASAPTIAANAHATQIQLTTQGAYYCYNDDSAGMVSLTISAANPTNPRIDVVVAQVADAAYSGSTNAWSLAVVTGTAASSPAVPTLPASCVPLALVWVPANASSIITADIIDLRVAYNRNPFRIGVTQGTAQADSNNVVTQFALNGVGWDIAGSFNTSTFNWTCPITGQYLITGQWLSSLFTSGDRYSMLKRNGAAFGPAIGATAQTTGGNHRQVYTYSNLFSESDVVGFYFTTPGTTAGAVQGGVLEIALLSPV